MLSIALTRHSCIFDKMSIYSEMYLLLLESFYDVHDDVDNVDVDVYGVYDDFHVDVDIFMMVLMFIMSMLKYMMSEKRLGHDMLGWVRLG